MQRVLAGRNSYNKNCPSSLIQQVILLLTKSGIQGGSILKHLVMWRIKDKKKRRATIPSSFVTDIFFELDDLDVSFEEHIHVQQKKEGKKVSFI
jgi:predicted flavoprotein YhiN